MADFIDIGTEKTPVIVNVDCIKFFEKIRNSDPTVDEPQTLVMVAGYPGDWKLETKVTFDELKARLKKFIR